MATYTVGKRIVRERAGHFKVLTGKVPAKGDIIKAGKERYEVTLRSADKAPAWLKVLRV